MKLGRRLFLATGQISAMGRGIFFLSLDGLLCCSLLGHKMESDARGRGLLGCVGRPGLLPLLGRGLRACAREVKWAFKPKWPDAQGYFEFCFILFSEACLNDILMKFV
jgi:hypothetical protein